MSAPKRGMVAGQPIKTGEMSKEFDEGFDRTFGERKPARGRFVYRPGVGMVEVGSDWTDTERRSQTPTEEIIYGGVRSTDGVDISSRTKHREYMKQNGLAMASDFSEATRQANERKKEIHEERHAREVVARAWHDNTEGRRK